MAIEISPDQINEYIAQSILSSAVGKSLKIAIDEEVKRLGQSYDNPYKRHVEAEVIRLIKELIETEFKEQIRQAIREKITDEFLNEILYSLWDKFLEKRY